MDLQALEVVGRDGALTATVDDPEPVRDRAPDGHRHIGCDGELTNQILLVAIFRNIRDTMVHRFLGRVKGNHFAVEQNLTGLRRGDPEDGSCHLGASGADQTGEAEYLAFPYGKADVAKLAAAGQPAYLK